MTCSSSQLVLGIILLIAILVIAYIFFQWHPLPKPGPDANLRQLSNAMWKLERLWISHIHQTRALLVESLAELDHAHVTRDGLLENVAQMGRNIGSVYGPEAGTKYTELLKNHLTTQLELITAAKQSKTTLANQLYEQWKTQGQGIVNYLGGLIPGLNTTKLQSHWNAYLESTLSEIVHTIRQERLLSATSFKNAEKNILEFSDELEEAISKDKKGKDLIGVTFPNH